MSNQELEVKFCCLEPATNLWQDSTKRHFEKAGFKLEEKAHKTLTNSYFDTPDNMFEAHKMGVRVRGCDGQFEQTLKTQKAVSGGVHQRNEFNVALPNDEPNVALFPTEAWPQALVGEVASMQLAAQFTTHFSRKTVLLHHAQGCCELVFDEGEIVTENRTKAINEIELELLDGPVSLLIHAAHILATNGIRLSDVSKAAQGYALLREGSKKITKLPLCLHLAQDATTQAVFTLSCEQALSHWQHHEHLYFESENPKFLGEVVTGIRLLLQSLALFLPIIQCEPMLKLQREVLTFSEQWLWVDELKSTRFLLSNKGPLYKKLAKHPTLISYLQGRQAGLIKRYQPELLLTSAQANAIKIGVMSLLIEKPWRAHTSLSDMPVIEHAKGWLSQGWQTLHQTMQSNQALMAIHYTSVERLMRQTLFNGFILSGLFANSTAARAPWLDILLGIEEVRALQLLKQALRDAELESANELDDWVDDKLQHLLHIMERTRNVAMNKSIYW